MRLGYLWNWDPCSAKNTHPFEMGWVFFATRQDFYLNDIGFAGASFLEATPGFEPGNQGFADPCLTTWLCRRTWGQARSLPPSAYAHQQPGIQPGARPAAVACEKFLAPAAGPAAAAFRQEHACSHNKWSGRRGSNPLPGIPRTAWPPFAGALPALSFHAPSAPGGGSGPGGGRFPAGTCLLP